MNWVGKTAAVAAAVAVAVAVAWILVLFGLYAWNNNNNWTDTAAVTSSESLLDTTRRLTDEKGSRHRQQKPIILLGLPRSGAESIHEFMQCLNYRSTYYHCCDENDQEDNKKSSCNTTCGACVHDNLLHHRPAFHKCGGSKVDVYAGFDVESQEPYSWFLPQHFALPLLHEHYDEKATWILNVRDDADNWATNVLHWYSVTNRILNAFDIPYHSDVVEETTKVTLTKSFTENELVEEFEKSLQRSESIVEHERRKVALIDIYEKHIEMVLDYHPNVHIINVDDDIAYKKLAKILHVVPVRASKCWTYDATKLDNDWKDLNLKV